MKQALTITSYIAAVIGSLAILSSLGGGVDAVYSLVGGVLFLSQGLLSLIYINQHK